MALFDFVENFFFISLGITFALILLLVYHFKQRISSMERKGDTMFELLSNVVKEMQCMKGINSYYKSLFNSSTCVEQPQPVCTFSIPPTLKSEPEKKVIDLTVSNDAFDVSPNVQVVKQLNDKMVVSDDDDVSEEDDDNDDNSSDYPETSDGSDLDDDESGSDDEDDNTVVSFDEMKYATVEVDNTITNVDTIDLQFEDLQSPIEVHDTLDDLGLLEHFSNEIETNSDPVVENDVEVDDIVSEEIPAENVTPSIPEVIVQENVESEVVAEAVQSGPTKEQKRDMYFKMNITQLKSIASVAGIQQDISKMKKKDLISLLESLDE